MEIETSLFFFSVITFVSKISCRWLSIIATNIAVFQKIEKETTAIKTIPKENSEAKAKEKRMMEERSKQTEERKDGKRRIQPIFLASTAIGTEATTSSETVPTVRKTTTATCSTSQPPKKKIALAANEVDLETSSDSGEDEDEEEEEEDSSGDEERSKNRKAPATTTDPMLAMELKKPVLRAMEPKRLITKEGEAVMEAPEQQAIISQNVQERKGMLVEVDNRWKHGGVETSQVKLVKKRQTGEVDEEDEEGKKIIQEVLWMGIVGAPVIIVAANK